MLPKPISVDFFMGNFSHVKFNPQDIYSIIGESKSSFTPTAKQVESAVMALNKEDLTSLSATDVNHILKYVEKHAMYTPEKISGTAKSYLCGWYAKEVYGLTQMQVFAEMNSRKFQANGIKSEKNAIEILSRVDGVGYKKNKSDFENDFFSGTPDIIHAGGVKEIKTVASLDDFMMLSFKKTFNAHEYQLQCYLDLVDSDSGELIYVATGLCKEERQRYLDFAREKLILQGLADFQIENKLSMLERNVDYSFMSDEKRIFRKEFKRNKYMIRFARKKVTAARAFLVKLDEKFNKDVILPHVDRGEAKSL